MAPARIYCVKIHRVVAVRRQEFDEPSILKICLNIPTGFEADATPGEDPAMHHISAIGSQGAGHNDFLLQSIHDETPSVKDLSPTDHPNAIVLREILGNFWPGVF